MPFCSTSRADSSGFSLPDGGFSYQHGDRVRFQKTVPTRNVGTRAFVRFTPSAPRSGTKTVPTRSVGTRAFLRFTPSAPRSGTKSVPTRNVGTRAFVRFMSSAPRSGTNTVPTRSIGTRAFVRFTSSALRSGTNTVPTRSVGTRAFLRRSVDTEIGKLMPACSLRFRSVRESQDSLVRSHRQTASHC